MLGRLSLVLLMACGPTPLGDDASVGDASSDRAFVDATSDLDGSRDSPILDSSALDGGTLDGSTNDGAANDGSALDGATLDAATDATSADGGPGYDASTNPSCEEAHADVLRLYQAFFARPPDVSGGNYWIDQYQAGQSVAAIARFFGDSAEFHALYDPLDNNAFVTAVYRNVLGRAPDASGRTHWVSELEGGLSRTDMVSSFAASDELRGRLPYAPSRFCVFVRSVSTGYTLRQAAPDTVYARSADGDVNVAFIDTGRGAIRVPTNELTTPSCTDRTIPTVRLRPPGHFGGTIAVNGGWFGCYLPQYFAGYSISAGTILGEVVNSRGEPVDGRRGYVGALTSGALAIGHYADHGAAVPPGLHHAVSGVTLVVSGTPWPPTTSASTDPTFTARNPRTMAGVRGTYLLLATVDGRSFGPGMTGLEGANLMVRLGADRALMLDGGGSSAMFVNGRGIVNQPSDGSTRSVANQLVFDAPGVWLH